MRDVDETDVGEVSERVWTVSELNRLVRDLLEESVEPFWLRAEIGNLTIHRSGHVYLTLKDERSQIPAVFFRGAESARQLELRTGVEIEVWGRLSVYEPRGAYQVIVSRLRPCGQGDLQRRFEELKARLCAEGLFDDDRKRAIPVLPRCVGVITSPEGAAIRDFLNILHRRFSNIHVRVVPTSVQGPGAAPQIAAGLRYLDRTGSCDVIVVTRGGGSLEDLWPFNEEVVARAVASCSVPVISAVGHERDFTICDFAADLRVPTPSAAAELVIAGKAEMNERIGNLARRLRNAVERRATDLRRRLERAAGSPVFREPAHIVRMYQQRVDEFSLRLAAALRTRAERDRARLTRLTAQLGALSPRNVLARGYAILLDEERGVAVRSSEETEAGASLRAILADGGLRVTVTETLADNGPADNEQ
jgi:exodeoxyribonuclease VII large subunit